MLSIESILPASTQLASVTHFKLKKKKRLEMYDEAITRNNNKQRN